MTYKIKDWDKFQHYKDRNPPWIKLATDTFQNYDFSCLQDASKLLAICSWTLAARTKDGSIPSDFSYIKRQCGLGDFIKLEHLKDLINKGYIIDASNTLAECLQDARPETETETEKRERKKVVGTRFALEALPHEWFQFCQTQRPDLNPGIVFDGFRDYWLAIPGAKGRKLDWDATWRNWIRNQKNSTGGLNAKSKFTIGIEGIAAARAKRLAAEQGQAR